MRLHCGDGPVRSGPGLAELRSSVSVLHADNELLERLLEDVVGFRSRQLRAVDAEGWSWRSDGAETTTQLKAESREMKQVSSTMRVAPRLAGPRRCIGKANKYLYSLSSSWQRWAKHMVSQGIVAPRSGLVQYWAQWDMHTVSYYFLRLRVHGTLRALRAVARGFIMRNAMRRWRQHANYLQAQAQALRSAQLQSAAETFCLGRACWRWWHQLVAGCTRSKNLRQKLMQCALQMRNKLEMLAIREWKAAVRCKQRCGQQIRLAWSHSKVAMLRNWFGRWTIYGVNARAEAHWWRTCLLRWQVAHSKEVHRQKMLLKLEEQVKRMRWGRLDSILRAWSSAAREENIERIAQRLREDKLSAIGRCSRARCIQAKWRDYRERKR